MSIQTDRIFVAVAIPIDRLRRITLKIVIYPEVNMTTFAKCVSGADKEIKIFHIY